MDVDLRSGAQGKDGGADPQRHDGDEHWPRHKPSPPRPLQPEVARHHGTPAVNSSWMSIFDQALKGKMEGLILNGMTATSIGPDTNQVLQGLSNLKWLVIM